MLLKLTSNLIIGRYIKSSVSYAEKFGNNRYLNAFNFL